MTSVARKYASFTAHEKPVAGDTKTSFVNDDHIGWLLCDGRELNKNSKYNNLLFQVIGYTFGVSGDTFNLPDPRGKVTGSVNSTYPPGTDIGSATHTLTINEMPSHNHSGTTGSSTTGITSNAPGGQGNLGLCIANGSNTVIDVDASPGELNVWTTPSALVLTDPGHTHTVASQGGGLPHNNIQPTLFIGNTFIYSGYPTFGAWPFTTGLNPVLI
jgi:microcystin-dependent protein